MPRTLGIGRRKLLNTVKIILIETSRPPIPSSCVRSKRKTVHEGKKYKLPAYYYFTPLIINDDLNMGDNICGNCSTNNQTIYLQDCDSNNVDMISLVVY